MSQIEWLSVEQIAKEKMFEFAQLLRDFFVCPNVIYSYQRARLSSNLQSESANNS